MDGGQVNTVCPSALETVQVRVDNLSVTLKRKYERHVHTQPNAQHIADSCYALKSRRNLNQKVWTVDPVPQRDSSSNSGLSVMGQQRRHLN